MKTMCIEFILWFNFIKQYINIYYYNYNINNYYDNFFHFKPYHKMYFVLKIKYKCYSEIAIHFYKI